MKRELLLLRHGKAKRPDDGPDRDRRLTTRGKRQAQKIGSWLQQNDAMPDLVLSSPAERALTTAEKAMKAGGAGTDAIRVVKTLYPGSTDVALSTIARECAAAPRRVMVVGHNPWMEYLAHYLATTLPTAVKNGEVMNTGILLRLIMPADWSRLSKGCAIVEDHVVPETLPDRFPFPGPDASEWRDRPAYYYRQSAAIPYRVTDGKPEILVVTSSKKKHWVVPKGIHDPGLTAWDSAAKEAEEEAGAVGTVSADCVGTYSYEKWGATCTVAVYPLRVTELTPERDWRESHRDRRWVTASEAVAHLKEPALAGIVAAFSASVAKAAN